MATAADPACNGTMNSSFQRQYSRDSNSTNSPTDADRLLSVVDPTVSTNNLTTSAGLSSSTGTTCSSGLVIHEPARPVMLFERGQNLSHSGYPRSDGGLSTLDRESLRAKSGDDTTAEYPESRSNSTGVGSTQGGGNDPRFHTYSTVSEALNQLTGLASTGQHSFTAGSQLLAAGAVSGSGGSVSVCAHNGGQLQPQPSLQLSHQTRQNYEVHPE